MHHIERHTIPLADTVLRERLDDVAELVEIQLNLARHQPERFSFLYMLSDLREYAGYLNLVDSSSPELCRALRLICRCIRALFSTITTSDETITILLDDDEPLSLPTISAREYATIDFWFLGYYAALICRDRLTLDTLTAIPLSTFQEETEASLPLFVETLQAFWKRDETTLRYLERALDATEPEKLHLDPDYILYLVVPEMELLFQSIQLNSQAFNQALVRALEQFRMYWNDPEQQQTRPRGFIALALLAYASLAHDLEISIEVTSDYLPAWIYQGGCYMAD